MQGFFCAKMLVISSAILYVFLPVKITVILSFAPQNGTR